MVSKIITETYRCDVCGATYATSASAQACEDVGLAVETPVKIGDKVRVLCGIGADNVYEVARTFIQPCDGALPHYYWHSQAVQIDLADRLGGSIVLKRGMYEVVR